MMSARELLSFRNQYFSVSVGITAAVFLLTALVGFIVLPYAQPELKFADLWDAICSAAGVPRVSNQSGAIQPDFKTSNAVMTSAMLTP